jgi:hypothetical protein
MKIIIKEQRTLPVSETLVRSLTELYKKAFLKLVKIHVERKIKKTGKPVYSQFLELFKKKYKINLDGTPFDETHLDWLIKNSKAKESIDRGYQLTTVPIKNLMPYILDEESLNTFIRGRMSEKQAANRIKAYFKERAVNDLQFNIEFSYASGTKGISDNDYAAAFYTNSVVVTVAFRINFFVNPLTDVFGSLQQIDQEIRNIDVSIIHELQHLYQGIYSRVLGTAVGLPPRNVRMGDAPRNDPDELQTHAETLVRKFTNIIKDFTEQPMNKRILGKKPNMLSKVSKLFLKKLVNNNLSEDEENYLQSTLLVGVDYILDTKLYPLQVDLENYKKLNVELYKYMLKLLHKSIDV